MKLASGRKSWEGIKSLLIQSLWVVGGKPAGGEGSDLTIKMRIPGVYKKSRAKWAPTSSFMPPAVMPVPPTRRYRPFGQAA